MYVYTLAAILCSQAGCCSNFCQLTFTRSWDLFIILFQQASQYKAENEKLREENRALISVVAKLSSK